MLVVLTHKKRSAIGATKVRLTKLRLCSPSMMARKRLLDEKKCFLFVNLNKLQATEETEDSCRKKCSEKKRLIRRIRKKNELSWLCEN